MLDKDWIKAKRVSDDAYNEIQIDEEFVNLGSGEKECIALCKQFPDSILFIKAEKQKLLNC
ncbi:MAG: hypothetical protein ACE5J3_11500 [Methanosarcinales archaeon]